MRIPQGHRAKGEAIIGRAPWFKHQASLVSAAKASPGREPVAVPKNYAAGLEMCRPGGACLKLAPKFPAAIA
jgi:hypothetical protein